MIDLFGKKNFQYQNYKNKINTIYYVGDTWLLRYDQLKEGINNKTCQIELEIMKNISANSIIFSNKYMKQALIDKYNLVHLNESLIINNSVFYNKNPYIQNNYENNKIRLVYLGLISNPKTNNIRDLYDIFDTITQDNRIELHIYPTKSFQNSYIPNKKNIIIHKTISIDKINIELSQYDFGLAYYNISNNDNTYLHIAEPNKFYDYYFAGIPIITNKTISFTDLIHKYKIGYTFSNHNQITYKNLVKKPRYVFTNKINTYDEIIKQKLNQLFHYKNGLKINFIQQTYISTSLINFSNSFKKKYNLIEYTNTNIPSIFFGFYTSTRPNDYEILKNHNSYVYVLWGGTDSTISENRNNMNKLLNRTEKVNSNLKIINIAQSLQIQNTLKKDQIESIYFPIFTSSIDLFKIPVQKKKAIYIYTSLKKPEKYGKQFYKEIIEKLPNERFIICHGQYKIEDMYDIYSKCFIGLRLTSHDGLGATVYELGLMGIKCVHNGDSPSALSWTNTNDIINHINNESKNIGKVDYELSEQVYKKTIEGYHFINMKKYN